MIETKKRTITSVTEEWVWNLKNIYTA